MNNMTTRGSHPSENPSDHIREGEPRERRVQREISHVRNQKRKAAQEEVAAPTASLQNARNNAQKTWAQEYIYSKDMPILGTLGKWITAKPVEGVVAGVTRSKGLGRIARVAAIAAGVYFGLDVLKQGAQMAFQGGNLLLDRIGIGGGQLYPSMNLPPAPPALQPLPGADIGMSA